jgi:hypothetical protein
MAFSADQKNEWRWDLPVAVTTSNYGVFATSHLLRICLSAFALQLRVATGAIGAVICDIVLIGIGKLLLRGRSRPQ